MLMVRNPCTHLLCAGNFLQDEFFSTLQTSIPDLLLANSHSLILMTTNANGIGPNVYHAQHYAL